MLGCVSRHEVYVGDESHKPVKELPMERQSKREGLAYNLVLEKVVAVLRVCLCVYMVFYSLQYTFTNTGDIFTTVL